MPPGVWRPDQGDGSYINPVLNGDYSDPDVVRVGQDYYLTASSFTNIPGLPILHSRDLVNWTLIGHALPRNVPAAHHAVPRHGGGVWAPAIRHREGRFYIYYPDPDFGIFMVSAGDPQGPWTEPVLVDGSKGAIDPAPFWDDDGQGWLVHAFAASRAGFANVIMLKKLSADGSRTLDAGRRIIEGDKLPMAATSRGPRPWTTTEGPKLYKRGGYYYVFAPAGSVKGGWQGVFRAKRIEGPYEGRNVMDQGGTAINGPHQGAWVDTVSGEDWFLHFSDTDSYGRRVFLQPMRWTADAWPLIGEQQGGEAYGAPVRAHKKPDVALQPAAVPIVAPVSDDEFNDGYHLGWQWAANPMPDWADSTVKGKLRLKSVSSSANLWEAGNLLTQKLPGMAFSVSTSVEFHPGATGERAGLLVMGYDYAWIGLENTAEGPRLVQVSRLKSNTYDLQQPLETVLGAPVKVQGPVYLRLTLGPVEVPMPAPPGQGYWPSMLRATHALASFSYSLDGLEFHSLGPAFTTQPGRWVGTQIGLFAQAPSATPSNTATRVGYADFDYFRFSR
jgi:beta-xylosidase